MVVNAVEENIAEKVGKEWIKGLGYGSEVGRTLS